MGVGLAVEESPAVAGSVWLPMGLDLAPAEALQGVFFALLGRLRFAVAGGAFGAVGVGAGVFVGADGWACVTPLLFGADGAEESAGLAGDDSWLD